MKSASSNHSFVPLRFSEKPAQTKFLPANPIPKQPTRSRARNLLLLLSPLDLKRERVVFGTLRKTFGFNHITCEEKEWCDSGADECVIKYGLRAFDPVLLKGFAKVSYDNLSSEKYDFVVETVEYNSSSFQFAVR